ncbi:MAG: sel1 repeat family protein [Legionella sp.]|nr:sel1 repeat family protein [Legionella sp.]
MKGITRSILIFNFCILLLSGCALHHVNLEEGIESFKVRDYRRAFIRLKPEAENGHVDAEYAVGYMYYYGQGVVEDREKAWYWIDSAAKAGQPDAVAALQIMHHNDIG